MEVEKKSKWTKSIKIWIALFVGSIVVVCLIAEKRNPNTPTVEAATIPAPAAGHFRNGPIMAARNERAIDRKKETEKPFDVPALFGKDTLFVNRMCGKPIYRFVSTTDNFVQMGYQSGRYRLYMDFDTKTKKAFTYKLNDTAFESFEIKQLLQYNDLDNNSSDYALSPIHMKNDMNVETYYGVEIVPKSSPSFTGTKRNQKLRGE